MTGLAAKIFYGRYKKRQSLSNVRRTNHGPNLEYERIVTMIVHFNRFGAFEQGTNPNPATSAEKHFSLRARDEREMSAGDVSRSLVAARQETFTNAYSKLRR